jgi:hypothetical protein
MVGMDEIPIEQIIARIQQRIRSGGGRHSAVWWFLRDRHDAIAAQIERDGANWQAMADTLAEQGVVDRAGKRATPRVIGRTWARVTKHVAAKRAKDRRQPPSSLLPGEIAPGVVAVRPVVPVQPAEPPSPARPVEVAPPQATKDAAADPFAEALSKLRPVWAGTGE